MRLRDIPIARRDRATEPIFSGFDVRQSTVCIRLAMDDAAAVAAAGVSSVMLVTAMI